MNPHPISPAGPDHGPFLNTQVSVYCDESRHEGQSKQRYMVIGGWWIQRDERQRLLEGLRFLQRQHAIAGEVKWNKLSKRSLPGYQALADYLVSQPDVHFRCIVVDKERMDADPMVRSDRQLGFWAFYAHCLKGWMGHHNTYYVSLDYKPSKQPFGPLRLKKLLDHDCVGRAWIRSIESVNSQENLFCQIADILIGAVGYEANGLAGSPTKLEFCQHVRASCAGSLPAKFNVHHLPA